ncbi:triacylglycerol lipase [Flavobacterium sp. 90]|uniref:esterase/lipase family protein n=1 Tax=unclassified Flavobacterium TaxID=196869 RepID=UPI000EAD9357|nr:MULTISPECIES: lipase [unclassified Flavobacterium]RKR11146.1 triacylglycerol lipase [Flavobacterium sp. 81]TCK54927.1 triacylglycerol lipase [Flavobacterium sp. 90]
MRKKIKIILLSFLITATSCSSDDNNKSYPDTNQTYPTIVQNKYPVVLVHGMLGWGRDEMNGFHYWGGKGDIQEDLKKEGYQVYTASMGPLSSNWDRAVELYYYIKGGTVDYGAVHAQKFGHNRYGRTYLGAYPQWDGVSKVHLVGHSMGGPTPRYLIELLENGDAQEMAFVAAAGEAPTSDLFKGGKKWIHSLTTVAGVHNGALTADYFEFRETLEKMFFGLAGLAGVTNESFYDFDLEQWGIKRNTGETIPAYFERIKNDNFWNSQDNCMYDLSVKASDLQNKNAKASSSIYYASYNIDGTEDDNNDGIRKPLKSMMEMLKPDAIKVGSTTISLPFGYMVWRPSDGLVSIPSAQYPIGDKYQIMDTEKRMLAPMGTWDVHSTIMGLDHMSIVIPDDKASTYKYLLDFYTQIAKDVSNLPQ